MLYTEEVSVWCALFGTKIIGPLFYYHNHRRGLFEHYWAVCSVVKENWPLLLFSTGQRVSPCCNGYYGCFQIFFPWPSYFIWSVASSVPGPKSTRLLRIGIPQRLRVFISAGDFWGLEGEYRLLLIGLPQRLSVFINASDFWGLECEYSVWNW